MQSGDHKAATTRTKYTLFEQIWDWTNKEGTLNTAGLLLLFVSITVPLFATILLADDEKGLGGYISRRLAASTKKYHEFVQQSRWDYSQDTSKLVDRGRDPESTLMLSSSVDSLEQMRTEAALKRSVELARAEAERTSGVTVRGLVESKVL